MSTASALCCAKCKAMNGPYAQFCGTCGMVLTAPSRTDLQCVPVLHIFFCICVHYVLSVITRYFYRHSEKFRQTSMPRVFPEIFPGNFFFKFRHKCTPQCHLRLKFSPLLAFWGELKDRGHGILCFSIWVHTLSNPFILGNNSFE